MIEAQKVRNAAGLPDDEQSLQRADTALGEVLVHAAQRYLSRVSDEWDIELFFETYGRPPRDGSSWSDAILTGLRSRADFAETDKQSLIDDAVAQAVGILRSP